jgi:hypothetical protein
MKQIFDGSAHTANILFGERYGVDWVYEEGGTGNIVVNGAVIKIGAEISQP